MIANAAISAMEKLAPLMNLLSIRKRSEATIAGRNRSVSSRGSAGEFRLTKTESGAVEAMTSYRQEHQKLIDTRYHRTQHFEFPVGRL